MVTKFWTKLGFEDLNLDIKKFLSSSILFSSMLNPAAILWPPPLIRIPFCLAAKIARPISNPKTDRQEPFAILLLDEITMVGLKNLSFIHLFAAHLAF